MDADNFKIGAGALTVDGTPVGGTTEKGAIVHFEPTVHLHKSGQYGDTPVKASYLGAKVTIEIEMAEHVLDNIEFAYAGVTRIGDSINIGAEAGTEVSGVALVLTPFDGSEAWYFRNAVPMGNVDAEYSATGERIIKATFQALIDATNPESSVYQS
jgi:hypothetical protein